MQCNLCKVLKEKKEVVFENKYAACILNSHPLTKAHLMVIPKRHVENLSDLTKNERADLLELVGKASILVQKYRKVDYCLIYVKEGSIKTEPHLHVHILPVRVPIRHLIAKFLKVAAKKKVSLKELLKVKEELQEVMKNNF